jgi:putative hydrolase of the HAD superfamily
VFCSERTGALKPSAHPFLELSAALGCPPDRVLYVGNHLVYDVEGAGRAGMKTALISRKTSASKTSASKPAPDFIFHDYRQLRDFVLI